MFYLLGSLVISALAFPCSPPAVKCAAAEMLPLKKPLMHTLTEEVRALVAPFEAAVKKAAQPKDASDCYATFPVRIALANAKNHAKANKEKICPEHVTYIRRTTRHLIDVKQLEWKALPAAEKSSLAGKAQKVKAALGVFLSQHK